MRNFLLELLECPQCRVGKLELKNPVYINEDIISGNLVCRCGKDYLILNGVPRFTPAEEISQVRKRFEYQWKKWGKDEVIFGRKKEESRRFFFDFSGKKITPEYLNGRSTLDAGCGHGRFTGIMAETGAFAVGLDLGDGVEVAYQKIKDMPNASIVQGDIMNPPFKKQAFDYIWSNGVIHHTPDTRRAFSRLAELVRPQGYLDIWVYPKKSLLWEASQKTIRAVTTHMPAGVLTFFCYLAVPLLSVVPTFSKTRFPKNSWRECAQVIYDWYSPQFQSHHTNDEVTAWYRQEGFDDLEVLGLPVTVSGRKA